MATVLAKPRAASRKPRAVSNGKPKQRPRSTFPKDAMLADVLDRLGGIPASRVYLHPLPGSATIRDMRRIDGRTRITCELIDGTIVEKAMGRYEAMLATQLSTDLNQFARDHKRGVVLGSDGTLRIIREQVRAADVSFISWERFPEGKLPINEAFPRLVPDLAVEVLSKGNTRREMERKLSEFFEAGVKLVWIIDPRRRKATIYTSPSTPTVIGENGVLDGGNALPGFRLTLRDLFDRVDRMRDELGKE